MPSPENPTPSGVRSVKGFTEQHLKDYLARHPDDPRIADALALAAPAAPQKQGRKGQEDGEGNTKARSKYGAVKTTYNGVTYDSKLEAACAEQLDILQRAGLVLEWTPQPAFDLGADVRYVADFQVVYATGQPRTIDAKGYSTAVFRLKRKFFEHLYGPLDVVKRAQDIPTEGR